MARDYGEKIIPIENLNMGGLADSKWSGIEHSLYKIIGFDLHSTPGIAKVAQKMTKNSGSTVDEFCKCAVNSSNGAQYWFSADSGAIWERTSGGTWRKVHTTTPAAGAAACLGAIEYQGYIYWATESRLHRIEVSKADDNNWTADAIEDWQTFTNTDPSFHPMVIQNLVLYIGDSNYIAQVDGSTFSANALDLKEPLRVKSLGKIATDILIGTYVSDNVTKTEIIRWNTWSVSFNVEDEIPENGVNAFIPGDNQVYVQAGKTGNIYFYNGTKLESYRRIPGDYSATAKAKVYPNAVGRKGNQIFFGLSNDTGNPAPQGIYQIGQNNRNYPGILDLPYPISQRTAGGDLALESLEVGAILVVGEDIYASWKYSGGYGVDKIDWNNKLDGAYIESRVINVERERFTNFSKAIVAYADKPTSTDVNIAYNKNYDGYSTIASAEKIDDTDRNCVVGELGFPATTLQIKWTMTVNGNDAMKIESGGIFIR